MKHMSRHEDWTRGEMKPDVSEEATLTCDKCPNCKTSTSIGKSKLRDGVNFPTSYVESVERRIRQGSGNVNVISCGTIVRGVSIGDFVLKWTREKQFNTLKGS